MSFLSEEEVIAAINPVLEEEDLKDAEVRISRGCQKGDGYVSQIVQVDVQGKDRTLNLIVKCGPRGEALQKSLVVGQMFHVEIYFYDKVVPAFSNFQKKIGTPFDLVPKCYRTVNEPDKKLLIFENLRVQGYRMWPRKEQMNEEHFIMMLKQYGKLHAVSAAMRQLDPEAFEELTNDKRNFYIQDDMKENKEIYNIFLLNADKTKSLFDPEKEAEYYETACRLRDNVIEVFEKIEDMTGDCPVIAHGDCWCNNMMFKYEDTSNPTKPTRAVLYDFQVLLLSSPAMDFSYFFYTAASKEMLDNHERYLKVYHDSFAEHLSLFGLDVEQIYPFKSLEKDWSFWAIYGILVATALFKAMLQEKSAEDIVDISDVGGDDMKLFDQFSSDLKSVVEDTKLRNLVYHLHRHKLI